jgi:hypothetical protein
MDQETPKQLENITVDRAKFDAVLRKMIASKPLPLKDVIGTSPRRKKERDSH